MNLEEIVNNKLDLYNILKSDKYDDLKTIKRRFLKLSKKYHPDKSGGNLDKFNLINIAYNILANEQSRQTYNNMINQTQINDYVSLKSGYNDFVTTTTSNLTADEAKIEFERKKKELEKKHKINDQQTNNQNLDKLIAERNQLTLNDTIDPNLMNRAFDHKKFEAAIFQQSTDITLNKLPSAIIPNQKFNDELNTVFDNLYDENTSTSSKNYASLDEAFKINTVGLTNNFDPNINNKLEQYKAETQQLYNLAPSEYQNNYDYGKITENLITDLDN